MSEITKIEILKEVEKSIETKNFGRMYDLGKRLVKLAMMDPAWLEVTVILISYIVKNPPTVFDALDLAKSATMAAHAHPNYFKLASKSLIGCIDALPTPLEQVEAASTVLRIANKDSELIQIFVDKMLEHISSVPDVNERERYLKIILQYAAHDIDRLSVTHELLRQLATKPTSTPEPKTADTTAPLVDFLDKHRSNTTELLKK